MTAKEKGMRERMVMFRFEALELPVEHPLRSRVPERVDERQITHMVVDNRATHPSRRIVAYTDLPTACAMSNGLNLLDDHGWYDHG